MRQVEGRQVDVTDTRALATERMVPRGEPLCGVRIAHLRVHFSLDERRQHVVRVAQVVVGKREIDVVAVPRFLHGGLALLVGHVGKFTLSDLQHMMAGISLSQRGSKAGRVFAELRDHGRIDSPLLVRKNIVGRALENVDLAGDGGNFRNDLHAR